MKKLTTLFWGVGLMAAVVFTVNAQASPPCFENTTDVDAELRGLQAGEHDYVVVKPGEKVCGSQDTEALVGIAFLAAEPPFIGEAKIPPSGLATVVRDPSGYFLTSLDAEGNQVTKVKLAQPKN